MSIPRKSLSAAFAIALAAGTVSVVAPTASAAADGSNVVINEVYGGGGNKGSVYSNDFVELFNPTDKPIDITGWKIEQYSAKGGLGTGHPHVLDGVIQPKSFFLVQGAAGNNDTGNFANKADQELNFNFSGKEATAKLLDANEQVVDLVGWGTAKNFEGSRPAAATTNDTSVQRNTDGADSDDNGADFFVGAPTPGTENGEESASNETPTDPTNPADPTTNPQPAPEPGALVTIAEIQGPGDKSPLEGKSVKTRGVVTAVYNEGGRKGFYMQTPGAGKVKGDGDASDAVFVYMGTAAPEAYPTRGSYIEVSGKVAEFNASTQLTAPTISALDEDFEPVTPVKIERLPDGDEARERYEGMLIKPGTHTVTDNYSFNTYGEIGIVPGTEPLRQPTDFMDPGSEAFKLEEEQRKNIVLLDDAATYKYFNGRTDIPLPYLETSDKGIKSMRVGDLLEFKDSGVILEYSFDAWRFQPLVPLTGKSPEEDLPVTWADTRAAVRNIPKEVQGDYSVASFNVLNYFTSLGENESGCKSHNDRFGTPVATNRCNVRGAFSPEAFKDQQAKIVRAISELDADVVGLMEIENNADGALNQLVSELNKVDGGKWAHNGSGTKVGTDMITVAAIYNKDKLEPVGDQVVLNNPAFSNARQPVAQAFKPKGGSDDETFVAVVNHFKSKGSVISGDGDKHDGQANNPRTRAAQAQALADELQKRSEWNDLPIFVMGDLNSYSLEDTIKKLNGAGYELVENNHYATTGVCRFAQDSSYAFKQHVGSLDHILANENARAIIKDAAVWNINADEPIVFQYSRRNYHGSDIFEADNPFASSDHDPVKVGFSFDKSAPVAEPGELAPECTPTTEPEEPTTEPTPEPTEPTTEPTPEPTEPTTEPTPEPTEPEEKPRYIVKAEINEAGELVVTYDNDESENLGKVTGEPGAQGPKGDKGEQGPKGDKGTQGPAGEDGKDGKDGRDGANGANGAPGKTGAAGQDGAPGKNGVDGKDGRDGVDGQNGKDGVDGKDGRGVQSFEVDDEGHLIVTYSDGEVADLGKITGNTADGKDGRDGAKGEDGADGQDGKDGVDGKDGKDGENGVNGQDGKDGEDGRGIANLEVNEDGELIATYTDGETQNLGRVVGADGADGQKGADGTDGRDGQDGKPGKDGEKGADGADGRDGKDGQDGANGTNAPAGEGSSVSDRCLPAVGIMALPLLALIPLGLAATVDVPALVPVKEQLNKVGSQLPITPEMQQTAGPIAGAALAIAAIATLAMVCSTEGGSSK